MPQGGHPGDVGVVGIEHDAALVDAVTPALGAALSEIRPAATMVIAGLIRPEMKIEIEVTAFHP